MIFYAIGNLTLRKMLGKLDIKTINKISINTACCSIPYLLILLCFEAKIWFYVTAFVVYAFCTGSLCSISITQAMNSIKKENISGYAAAVIGISGSLGCSIVSTFMSLSGKYQNITLIILISIALSSSAYLIYKK